MAFGPLVTQCEQLQTQQRVLTEVDITLREARPNVPEQSCNKMTEAGENCFPGHSRDLGGISVCVEIHSSQAPGHVCSHCLPQ